VLEGEVTATFGIRRIGVHRNKYKNACSTTRSLGHTNSYKRMIHDNYANATSTYRLFNHPHSVFLFVSLMSFLLYSLQSHVFIESV
jgi:hypothetical protein